MSVENVVGKMLAEQIVNTNDDKCNCTFEVIDDKRRCFIHKIHNCCNLGYLYQIAPIFIDGLVYYNYIHDSKIPKYNMLKTFQLREKPDVCKSQDIKESARVVNYFLEMIKQNQNKQQYQNMEVILFICLFDIIIKYYDIFKTDIQFMKAVKHKLLTTIEDDLVYQKISKCLYEVFGQKEYIFQVWKEYLVNIVIDE